MANYRHKVLAKCYFQEAVREEGAIVVVRKPFEEDNLPSYMDPMDYSYEDGKIKYNPGVDAYGKAPLAIVEDDDEDEPEIEPVKIGKEAAKLADEMNIDVSELEGTGKDGALTKADIQKEIDRLTGDVI